MKYAHGLLYLLIIEKGMHYILGNMLYSNYREGNLVTAEGICITIAMTLTTSHLNMLGKSIASLQAWRMQNVLRKIICWERGKCWSQFLISIFFFFSVKVIFIP